MRRLREHLTYANVMSSIAAFMAISGVAWAATALPKNSVGSAQIKKNAVISSKIRNGQVQGVDAKANTFTGTQINEGTLGQVPSAASADNATNAANAVNATNATNAANATNATNAANAANADNAANAANATNATNATNAANATTAGNAAQLAGAGPETYNIGRAYGYINEEGTVEAGRTRNIISVNRPFNGVYCVTLAPGIDVSTIAPVVTLDKHDSATNFMPDANNDQGIIEWDSVNEDCPAGQLEVDSFEQQFTGGALIGNIRDNQSFMIFIP